MMTNLTDAIAPSLLPVGREGYVVEQVWPSNLPVQPPHPPDESYDVTPEEVLLRWRFGDLMIAIEHYNRLSGDVRLLAVLGARTEAR